MGVVRSFKSTGDMLDAAPARSAATNESALVRSTREQSASLAAASRRKRRLRRRQIDSDYDDEKNNCSSAAAGEEESDDDDDDQDDDELARTRPLLAVGQQLDNGSRRERCATKWNSCKLLGNTNTSDANRDQVFWAAAEQKKCRQKKTRNKEEELEQYNHHHYKSRRHQQQQEESPEIELKKWTNYGDNDDGNDVGRMQSKSMADLLVLGLQRRLSEKRREDKKEEDEEKATQKTTATTPPQLIRTLKPSYGNNHEYSAGGHRRPPSLSPQARHRTRVVSKLSSSSSSRRTPNGARRPLRGAAASSASASSRMKQLASLSLSSPALAREQETLLARERRLRRLQLASDANNASASQRPTEDNNAVAAAAGRGGGHVQQVADVHACETKASSDARQPLAHCFVDVIELQRQQPATGHWLLSNERPDDCAKDVNEGSCAGLSVVVVRSAPERQDNLSGRQQQQQQPGNKASANDNGLGRLPDDDDDLYHHSQVVGGRLLPATKVVSANEAFDGSLAANATRTPSTATALAAQPQLPVVNSLPLADNPQLDCFHYAPFQAVARQTGRASGNSHNSGSSTTTTGATVVSSSSGSNNNNNNNQLVLAVKTDGTTAAAAAGNELAATNKLMADLNSTAHRLVGSCRSSWLHQALGTGNSGSYKVAQRQKAATATAISGLVDQRQLLGLEQETSAGETHTATIDQLEQASGDSVAASQQQQRLLLHQRRIARYSRPGRSPISLQRHTNARLTRHRLKIQQQRQEQLARLALQERLELSTNPQQQQQHQHHYQYQARPSHEIIEPVSVIEGQSARPISAELSYSNHPSESFLERVSFARWLGGRGQQQATGRLNRSPEERIAQQSSLFATTIANQHDHRLAAHAYQHHQARRQQPVQHQVIMPPSTTARAVEICDNQLACGSRQGQQQLALANSSVTTAASASSQRFSASANVIVYKSINMLRNGSSESDTGQSRSLNNGAGSGRSGRHNSQRSQQMNDQYDNIESEDTQTISSSGSTISLNKPFCKICHMGSSKNGDKLISPCKCSGTMRYIHCGCLLKWLEISNRTNEKPMSCELCAHEYTWHKKFNYRHMRLPKCSLKDVFLHLIFVVAIGVMSFAVLAPILYRKSHDSQLDTTDQRQPAASSTSYRMSTSDGGGGGGGGGGDESQTSARSRHYSPLHHHSSAFNGGGGQGSNNHLATAHLARDEKFLLLCAASFFTSFFLAIYVQTQARDTPYGLLVKFLSMNQTYYITEYDHGQMTSGGGNNNSSGMNGGSGNSSSGGGGGGGGGNNNSANNTSNKHHHHRQQQDHQQHLHQQHHHQQNPQQLQQQEPQQQQQQQHGGSVSEELRVERKSSQKS